MALPQRYVDGPGRPSLRRGFDSANILIRFHADEGELMVRGIVARQPAKRGVTKALGSAGLRKLSQPGRARDLTPRGLREKRHAKKV